MNNIKSEFYSEVDTDTADIVHMGWTLIRQFMPLLHWAFDTCMEILSSKVDYKYNE